MKISDLIFGSQSNTDFSINFPELYLTLYNIKIQVYNLISTGVSVSNQPVLYQGIIIIYDNVGSTLSTITINNAMTITFNYANYSKIQFKNMTNFIVYYSYQMINFDNEDEYNTYKGKATADVNVQPPQNINVIYSPITTIIFNGPIGGSTSTSNTFYRYYKPARRNISVYLNIQSISGCSVVLWVAGVDPQGYIAFNNYIFESSSVSSAGIYVYNVNLGGANNIVIGLNFTLSSGSNSFTIQPVISVEE